MGFTVAGEDEGGDHGHRLALSGKGLAGPGPNWAREPFGQPRLVQFPRVSSAVHASEVRGDQQQILMADMSTIDLLEHQVLSAWRRQEPGQKNRGTQAGEPGMVGESALPDAR